MSSGTVAIWATKDGDYAPTEFAGTTAGLQAAIDYLAGGKGQVFVGPGTLLTTACIWLHSGCTLQGAGIGVTVLKRSTMTDADGNNTGAVVAVSPYGSNGTLPTSSTSQSDITVSDMTLDGNYSSFTITVAGINGCGLRGDFVDGFRVNRVRCQNTLMDGFRWNNSQNVYVTDVETDTVGQSGLVASQNAISFYGGADIAGGWGSNFSVKGASLVNTGDEALTITSANNVTVSDVIVDGCDFVVEVTDCNSGGHTHTAGSTYGNWTISNVTAINCLSYFITFAPSLADSYRNVTFSNCSMYGHATLHDGGAIALPSASGAHINDFVFTGCVFGNINTKDTTTRHWFDSQPGDTTGHANITISECLFYGKSGSTRNGAEVGFNIRGSHTNITLDKVTLRDVAGSGVMIHDTTAYAATASTGIRLYGVTVDGANDYGFRVRAASASSTASITEVLFSECTARNTNKQTTGAGFWIYGSQAGVTIQGVRLIGCRAHKTSGTTMTYAVNLEQSAGTMDEIEISGCDFRGVQTGPFIAAGTITNVHFAPRTGKGTDIASAATISIPADGSVFHVTGTTNITNGITVNKWDNGRTVSLVFDDILTVSDTGTSVLQGNFTSAANDVLCLVCDGTNWVEVSRN